MAKRICFVSKPLETPIYEEIVVDFKYFNGFAVSQKQKSIRSLHESIRKLDASLHILEISTKSTDPIGVALSAFNLKFYNFVDEKEYLIENIFQSSKVFEKGGPYRDLLYVHPRDAKRDERLYSSGKLTHFNFNNTIWKTMPKTMFYDWIYISSLNRNKELAKKIMDYDAFTDIEFNHEKSINCQARAAAIFVSLVKLNKLDEVINDKEEFMKIYETLDEGVQLSLFDF